MLKSFLKETVALVAVVLMAALALGAAVFIFGAALVGYLSKDVKGTRVGKQLIRGINKLDDLIQA